MASEKAKQLAESIFSDFRGAGYYADPKILCGFLKGDLENEQQAESHAIEILRHLLRRYAEEYAGDQDIEQLAQLLDR